MEENAKKALPKKPVWITVGVLAAVVLLYLILCAFVYLSGTVLPGIYAGEVKLSGRIEGEAALALDSWVRDRTKNVECVLTCGDKSVRLEGELAGVDSAEVAGQAWQIGREHGFLGSGAVLIGRIFGGRMQLACPVSISPRGQAKLDAALDELGADVDAPLVETVWAVEDTTLTITKGISGIAVDREKAQTDLVAYLEGERGGAIVVDLVTAHPEALDVQELFDAVFCEAKDATVDEQTYQVLPHVVGLSFDKEAVGAQFAALAEGETMSVALTVTMPQLTQEKLQKKLFADVLGECTTNIGGTANRLNNVKVAAAALHNVVIMPDGVFSYNDTLGPRTSERGYKGAPAYVGGKTVDEVGGGICQNSSTLYLAALRANLEIVERRNHMYAVGYVPDGLDATVAYNAIDFRFRNNTGYPIRLEVTVDGRTLLVRIHGTQKDDTTVKMETQRVSTTSYTTIYKEDPSVPVGSTVVDTTPYTGRKVLAYRCVYDGQGNLISRTLESTNTYRHRDKVVLYNPADAAQYTGGTVTPVAPENPVTPDTPAVPDSPAVPETPEQGETAVETEVPVETPPATETPEQSGTGEETQSPTQSPADSQPAEVVPAA